MLNDSAHWRGEIGTYFSDDDWTQWFASYATYLTYIATVARDSGVNMLNIGTELSASQHQTQHWHAIITAVRAIFTGPLTYGANWFPGPSDIVWWDQLDFIGVDAYYPLTDLVSPSVSDIEQGWRSVLPSLASVSAQYNRSVLFLEVGYQSTNDTAIHPWGSNGGLDMQTQANCFSALFSVAYTQPWFAGVFIWAWTNDPSDGGPTDRGFSPHNKTAEAVIHSVYSA